MIGVELLPDALLVRGRLQVTWIANASGAPALQNTTLCWTPTPPSAFTARRPHLDNDNADLTPFLRKICCLIAATSVVPTRLCRVKTVAARLAAGPAQNLKPKRPLGELNKLKL